MILCAGIVAKSSVTPLLRSTAMNEPHSAVISSSTGSLRTPSARRSARERRAHHVAAQQELPGVRQGVSGDALDRHSVPGARSAWGGRERCEKPSADGAGVVDEVSAVPRPRHLRDQRPRIRLAQQHRHLRIPPLKKWRVRYVSCGDQGTLVGPTSRNETPKPSLVLFGPTGSAGKSKALPRPSARRC